MRPVYLALAALAFVTLPGCAAETDEEVGSSAAALEAEWAEIDEDATPITAAEKAEAVAENDDDGDDDASASADTSGPSDVDADPGDPLQVQAAAPVIAPPPALPKSCDKATSLDLVVYTEGYNAPILKALADHAKPCSRYTISIPKVGGSAKVPDAALWPRPVKGQGVRAYGNEFVASAEVHWGGSRATGTFYPGWKNVKVVKVGPAQYKTVRVKKSEYYDSDWFYKGVLFRQRMAKRGYRPQAGDTWHLNELESAWTRNRPQQRAIRQLVRGLAAGDQEYDAAKDTDPEIVKLSAAEKAEITKAARMQDVKGILYISAIDKRRPGETTSDRALAALKQTLRHKRFWVDMNNYVASFGVERYLAFGAFCQKNNSLATQSSTMAGQIMELEEVALHAPRYQSGARAGQSTVGTALSYLSRAYHPIVTAAWGYNNDNRTLSQMAQFVAGEIYATRAYANTHRTPDERIGIYFKTKDDATPSQTAQYSDRVAASLNGAYDGRDGNAIGACVGGADACTCGD